VLNIELITLDKKKHCYKAWANLTLSQGFENKLKESKINQNF
jgi:hypothetical protein